MHDVRTGWLCSLAAVGAVLVAGCARNSPPLIETSQPAAEPPAQVETGFYYHFEGERIPLTVSLEWITVMFADMDAAAREAALEPYASRLGALDEIRELPAPALTLLPLPAGATLQDALDLLELLRADAGILHANPLFESGQVWMAVADQFIAAFPAGMGADEIASVNALYDIGIVQPILGQENTFLLRVAPGSALDALAAANLYQERGIALHAAPNFIRITR